MKKYYQLNINAIKSEIEAKEILQSLISDLEMHNKAYYIDSSPLISDADYDYLFNIYLQLEQRFSNLVQNNSLSSKVGFTPSNKFQKIKHKIPMLSLSNAFDQKDIKDFIERIQRFLNIAYLPDITCEPKIDGVSFTAIYIDGYLSVGATRGDGVIGEDITNNLKTIGSLPNKINGAPKILEVRGEVYIAKSDFIKMNEYLNDKNDKRFANPRNAASGALRQLDSNITKSRPLRYYAYSIGQCSDEIANNQYDLLQKLRDFGFVVNELCIKTNLLTNLFDHYEYLQSIRKEIDYETDGLVYKINDFELQQRMGFIARSPRFAIAHKFPSEISKTRLLNITVQVGRTGAITPVAHLDPVLVSGAVISKATLHNYQEILSKDIRIGDYIYFQRAGDVIPKIIGVDLNLREDNVKQFIFPSICPSCGSKLNSNGNDVIIRCNNGLSCPDQNYERICHFVSKNALDIQGLGKKQVQFLIEHSFIKNPVDIFFLKDTHNKNAVKLETMAGWGVKSLQNLIASIESSKSIDLAKFIFALGIRTIGQSNAKLLAQEFKTVFIFFDSMIALSKNDSYIHNSIENIQGIGNQTVSEIVDFFKVNENIETIKKLIDILDVHDYQNNQITSKINGKIVVFTGTLTNLSRAEAKFQAEKLGAKVSNAISSSTNLLIAGESSGSKLKKAKEYNVEILNEEEWLKIVQDSS
ncbi:MAG: NAD-dependent DNA ligase LigA [Rickettsiaceae bacterium]